MFSFENPNEKEFEPDFLVRRPLISQEDAFQSFITSSSSSSSRKRKKKFQNQSWNTKEKTDVFRKIDQWQNNSKEIESTKKETGGTSNSYTQFGLY